MANFRFDDASHTYTLDGEILPSVTHIIRFLSVDTDKTRPWLRDSAAERGTIIHSACAMFDYGEPDAQGMLPYEFHRYFSAYLAFLRDYRPAWDYIEKPLYGERNGFKFAGTLDRSGMINGRYAIVDLKTGTSGDKAQYMAQLTGYSILNRTPDADLYILQLAQDGTYTFKQYGANYGIFDACIELYKARSPKRKDNK